MSPSLFFRLGAGILVVATALRVAALGRSELWHDEFCSLLMLADPKGVLAAAASSATTPDGGNPPLYYLLLAAWTRVLGLSEPAVRSLSLVASVAQVAVTGALVRTIGGSRPAALAAMAVAAVASLHVFYGTEARAYSLLLLLLTVALWTFFRAIRSGRPIDWALHAVALLAAWFTHNLALPFTASFWIAALVLRADRRAFLGLAAAHAAVVVLYSPWIPVLLAQSGSETHRWIRLWWERTPTWRLVPWSLEVLGLAGPAPEYLDVPSVTAAARWGSAALTAAAGLAAFAPGRAAIPRRTAAALAVFVLVPLAFLLLYSVVKAPLYVVGRYDLPAQAALIALVGPGLARIGARLGRAGAGAIVLTAALIAFAGNHDRILRPAIRPRTHDKADRAAILARYAEPGDLVVCTGFLASEVLGQAFREGIALDVATFPPALRSHVGWYNPGDDLARGEDAVRAEADELVREARTRPHTWLVSQPGAGTGPHARILTILLSVLEDAGCRALYPPKDEARWRALGVCAIVCGNGDAGE